VNLRLLAVELALSDFALELEVEVSAQVTAVFGPSGSGKTSALELVAGLRRAQAGRIDLNGRLLFDARSGYELPARLRRMGYVPQDDTLFPHLSVEWNLRYGAKTHPPRDRLFTFDRVVSVLELESVLGRGTGHLSGGERRRVALARALLSSPELLLLDEPLTGLDEKLKARVVPYLKRINSEFSVPCLYVTHDPEEVLALCDEVLVLERGRLVSRGRPADVFTVSSQPTYAVRAE
jgi:molybdate transport system ATP-binding protein